MRLRIESMSSAVQADNLEAALEAAIRRFDGTSPVTPQVHHHFGYAGDAPGSRARLRMQLVLEVVAEEDGSLEDGVDVACAVEILHNSTLVHDNVEDGAWARFGLAHGINAGDALCAMAYLQLLEGPARRAPEQTVLMTRALQEANFALCAGQAQEIAFERDGSIGPDAYLAMIGGKAALFAVACELGALVAGATPERTQAYARLGRTSGMAFQMEDHVQSDPASRLWTLPDLVSLSTAHAYLAEGDALASAAGIDRSGRVRAFIARAIRPAA
jgi:geranylgeranyl diphosphate synthase type I